MHPIWKSNSGKLIAGGCGSQVGAILTCGFLAVLLSFCAVCAFTNVMLGVTQEIARPPTATPVRIQAVSSADQLDLLRVKLDLLNRRMQLIQANPPAAPRPSTIPLPGKALAMAIQNAANLRSGPGTHYTRLGRLSPGESLEIVGRNDDSTWWLVTAPNGQFAWVADIAVATFNVDASLPVVSIPALLVQPGGTPNPNLAAITLLPETGDPTSLPLPAGTPTAVASQSRRFVQDTRGYKQLTRRLLLPTVSESFSPDGSQIAITEKIKLYLIPADGDTVRVLLADNETINLIGRAVWSPDGQYIAFVAKNIQSRDSGRFVGLARLADGSITYLDPPYAGANIDMPRWTQDGRLLVNVHPGEPATGTVYVYNTAGQADQAGGNFLLSSSHAGQKWWPWQPGRTWQVNPERPSDYYGD